MKSLSFAAASAAALLAADAHALGHLADISLYDRARRETLPVYEHRGRYYVAGKPGNEYEIRLDNRQGRDVLAVISVDGVNVVSGESAAWHQTGYVLSPWADANIQGWRKSMDRTAAFYFTRLPDSYAARTGRPDDVGVIGVALFESRHLPPPVAYEHDGRFEAPASAAADSAAGTAESRAAAPEAARQRAEKSLGTGHGRSEYSPVRNVDFERASAQPAEVVVIHYDSHRNLVARGVIPRHDAHRHDPNPFPAGFVPDPGPLWRHGG